ncbi:MAG: hypothetical protein NVS2B12_30810 [Ktedonobacteraceae bacterium]
MLLFFVAPELLTQNTHQGMLFLALVYTEARMKFIQRSGTQLLLLLLSLVGAAIAVYLTTVHYENVPLYCSANGLVDCTRVLSSTYSNIPGTAIPITVPGLAWCIAGAALAIAGLTCVFIPRWLKMTQFLLSLAGMLVVLYLAYIEIVRLHTICAWCTALHVIILITFLATLVQLRPSRRVESEPETVDEKPIVTTMRTPK